MIKITKEESKKLNQMGYLFGVSIHKTHSKKPHYYLVEETKAMNDLKKIRIKNEAD